MSSEMKRQGLYLAKRSDGITSCIVATRTDLSLHIS